VDTAGPGPGIIVVMGCTVITGGLLPAREAADKFFSSVMMKAQSFMNPNASPYIHTQYSTSYTHIAYQIVFVQWLIIEARYGRLTMLSLRLLSDLYFYLNSLEIQQINVLLHLIERQGDLDFTVWQWLFQGSTA